MITPRIIVVALNFLTVSVFCLTPGQIEAQKSGWNLTPNTQYHIQTDEGPERYFRYQTLNGQYRKEKRLADGTVIGTEGWLDPLGYLRIKDYIADTEGYRILRSKMVYVGEERPIEEAVSISKKVPAQSGILAKPQRPVNPFRQPELKELPGNGIEANTVTPLGSTASAPVHPGVHYQLPISTPAPVAPPTLYSPYGERAPLQTLEDGYSQPNTNYLPAFTPYQQPYVNQYNRYNQNPYSGYNQAAPPPSAVFQPPLYGQRYPEVGQGFRAYDSTRNETLRRSEIVQASPPAEQRTQTSGGQFPEYDGTHTVKDGFQYYLKTHYHEEENRPSEDEKIGSFGYIDPFGIRRVVYYKADAEHGFIHKKNNRYVGFQATPYDPQLPSRT
ncbi:uncharacterized protein LOC124296680 isoform X1 [Neodiprion virginianus]|uniref:Uncharacterized protein LOC107219844 isoform X1 n=1 Tax=Neodiprion lecontei TaxID=441921 RepID=A0A6J0BFR7_NEOLC|nr:uncharacterized protein LOC107219844 isoform X1 [Neodiprion lecontei]XP_046409440.1 uncharacterized protein LOC124174382 isoform X1 [Neodiprion fabricii]XP_046602867.1 uncharacterized protein LOC124296680 isoform X1 [Neodiprion virginianus]